MGKLLKTPGSKPNKIGNSRDLVSGATVTTGNKVVTGDAPIREESAIYGMRWLGVPKSVSSKIGSVYDVIIFSHKGITKKSVDVLAGYLGISKKNMAEKIFDVSIKTLERKEDAARLDRKTSSHALEIAKVVQHAYEIFQNEEKVRQWLNRENKALNNMKPVDLFDTLTGLNTVNDILGRIEEGVYS